MVYFLNWSIYLFLMNNIFHLLNPLKTSALLFRSFLDVFKEQWTSVVLEIFFNVQKELQRNAKET